MVSTLGPDGYERRVQDISGLTLAVLEGSAVYHDETTLLPGHPTIYLLPFSERGRGLTRGNYKNCRPQVVPLI